MIAAYGPAQSSMIPPDFTSQRAVLIIVKSSPQSVLCPRILRASANTTRFFQNHVTEEIGSSLDLTMLHSVGILCLIVIHKGERDVSHLPGGAL